MPATPVSEHTARVGTLARTLMARWRLRTARWMARRPTYDERGGAVVMFVAIMSFALLIGSGVVIDDGNALAGRRNAMTVAEQAARVGADALNDDALRGGTFEVDPPAAINAAQRYLHSAGVTGTVTVNGAHVTVTVTSQVRTRILSAVGINQLPANAKATASAIDEDTN